LSILIQKGQGNKSVKVTLGASGFVLAKHNNSCAFLLMLSYGEVTETDFFLA
jgi:hypothetical protein